MRDRADGNSELWQFLHEKPWRPFLKDVDVVLMGEVTLYCIGGFVMKALYDVPRITGDLDYVEVFPKEGAAQLEEIAGQDSTLAKKHEVFIHYAGPVEMPIQYEERLQKLDMGLKNLRLYVPDPYDLLLSKMLRNSGKDREDGKFLIKKLRLRFETMEERFRTELDWVSNRAYHETSLELWKDFFSE